MDNEKGDAFSSGLILGALVSLIVVLMFLNFSAFNYKEMQDKINQCEQANSKIKKLYLDGDVECENGAKF